MQKTCFKVFFSKIKETEWLNSMGSMGYRLIKISDSKYTFEHCENTKFFYSIEYFENSPNSDIAVEYYEAGKKEGTIPIIVSGNWLYFMKEGAAIVRDANTYKQNAGCYLTRAIYMFFFAFVGCLVNGYQFYSIHFLEKVGHISDAEVITPLVVKDAEGILQKIINLAKNLLNLLIGLANDYFGLWFKVFGESDAIAVISIILPITVALIVLACFNLDEYLKHKKLYRTALPFDDSDAKEEESNAE